MNDNQVYEWKTTEEGKVWGGYALTQQLIYPEMLEAWEKLFGSPVVEIARSEERTERYWRFDYDERKIIWTRP